MIIKWKKKGFIQLQKTSKETNQEAATYSKCSEILIKISKFLWKSSFLVMLYATGLQL